MRCHQVLVKGKVAMWVGSMAEARAAKKELVENNEGLKASSITYAEAEVPVSKPELLAFLNEHNVEDYLD